MKRRFFSVIIILALAALVAALWRDTSSRQVLPDGTELVLSGVEIGYSNVYTHGSNLSKLLGGLVPSNGVSVGKFKLRRAEVYRMPSIDGCELLTAELCLPPGSPREKNFLNPPFYRNHRLLISGDEDAYVFVRGLEDFRKFDDGWFSRIWASAFPRDSQRLHFRLEERDSATNRNWRELTTFVIKNPKPARIEPWTADAHPRFQLHDELEVEVGELTVSHEPHRTDIWEYSGELPLKITRSGQAVTNWGMLEGKVRDSSGNFDQLPASWKNLTNDWMVYRIFRPLDPTKLWKFHVKIGQDRDFPATNLFSFAVPYPLPAPVQTNLGGFACQIEFVNATMLSLQLTEKPAGMRLSFVSAADTEGADLYEHSGSWGQHLFWRSLKLTKPTQVHATIAIRPETEIEFTLQPKYERRSKAGGK